MKLKKFAALALAGMMAVSMLAACSDKTTTGEEEDNQIVATSDAVTYANDALSASMKEHATFKANPTLDGWVKDIATDTSVFEATDIEYTYKNLFDAKGNGTDRAHQQDMRNELTKKLMDSNVLVTTDFTAVPADKASQCSSWLYTVSGSLDEKAAVQMAVKTVSGTVSGDDFPLTIGDNKYTCEYSPEISALRVTNESLTGESAWVVAIVVTQTVTEAANVEA